MCSTPSTTEPSECALLCGRNPQCAGWTQKLATTNTCFLKTRGDHKNNDPEWVHGPPCTGFLVVLVFKLLAPSGALVFIMVYYIPSNHFFRFFKFFRFENESESVSNVKYTNTRLHKYANTEIQSA